MTDLVEKHLKRWEVFKFESSEAINMWRAFGEAIEKESRLEALKEMALQVRLRIVQTQEQEDKLQLLLKELEG